MYAKETIRAIFSPLSMLTLSPVNGRKSFYNKCRVIETGDDLALLQSYNTIVATYNKKTKRMVVNGWYSNTTASHINAFLDYFNFPTVSKKIMQDWKNHEYNFCLRCGTEDLRGDRFYCSDCKTKL